MRGILLLLVGVVLVQACEAERWNTPALCDVNDTRVRSNQNITFMCDININGNLSTNNVTFYWNMTGHYQYSINVNENGTWQSYNDTLLDFPHSERNFLIYINSLGWANLSSVETCDPHLLGFRVYDYATFYVDDYNDNNRCGEGVWEIYARSNTTINTTYKDKIYLVYGGAVDAEIINFDFDGSIAHSGNATLGNSIITWEDSRGYYGVVDFDAGSTGTMNVTNSRFFRMIDIPTSQINLVNTTLTGSKTYTIGNPSNLYLNNTEIQYLDTNANRLQIWTSSDDFSSIGTNDTDGAGDLEIDHPTGMSGFLNYKDSDPVSIWSGGIAQRTFPICLYNDSFVTPANDSCNITLFNEDDGIVEGSGILNVGGCVNITVSNIHPVNDEWDTLSIQANGITQRQILMFQDSTEQAGGSYVGFAVANAQVCNPMVCGMKLDHSRYLLENLSCPTGTAIELVNDSIFLDCDGFTVNGSNASSNFGVNVSRQNNVTVRNCFIHSFRRGLYSHDAHNMTVENNDVRRNGFQATYWINVTYSNIRNNTFIQKNGTGATFHCGGYLTYNNVSDNIINNTGGGPAIYHVIVFNSHYWNNTISANTNVAEADLYIANTLFEDSVVTSTTGGAVWGAFNNNNTYRNINFSSGNTVAYFQTTALLNFTNNRIYNTNIGYGLRFNNADNNYVTNSIINTSNNYPIYIHGGSMNNNFRNVYVDGNTFYGIYLNGANTGNEFDNMSVYTTTQPALYTNSDSNTFLNSRFETTAQNACVLSLSDYNYFDHVACNNTGDTSYGLAMTTSTFNTYNNSFFEGNFGMLFLTNSNDNNITSSHFKGATICSIYWLNAPNRRNWFINNTFSCVTPVLYFVNNGNSFWVADYVWVNVTDSSGDPLAGVEVDVVDGLSNQTFNGLTDSSGFTDMFISIDYYTQCDAIACSTTDYQDHVVDASLQHYHTSRNNLWDTGLDDILDLVLGLKGPPAHKKNSMVYPIWITLIVIGAVFTALLFTVGRQRRLTIYPVAGIMWLMVGAASAEVSEIVVFDLSDYLLGETYPMLVILFSLFGLALFIKFIFEMAEYFKTKGEEVTN